MSMAFYYNSCKSLGECTATDPGWSPALISSAAAPALWPVAGHSKASHFPSSLFSDQDKQREIRYTVRHEHLVAFKHTVMKLRDVFVLEFL